MLEKVVLYNLIYKLDFIDLSILENIVLNDYMLSFPNLVRRLEKVNVWNKGIIRRRIKILKELKILHFEENTHPLLIEVYQHNEEQIKLIKELLKRRLVRY